MEVNDVYSWFHVCTHYTSHAHITIWLVKMKRCVMLIWMFECWHSYSLLLNTLLLTTTYTSSQIRIKLFSVVSILHISLCVLSGSDSNSSSFSFEKCFHCCCCFNLDCVRVWILVFFCCCCCFVFCCFVLILYLYILMVLNDDSHCTHTLKRRNSNCCGKTYHICCECV